ncbi:MAG: hypothetical protein ACYCZW_00755 [Minisyncoccota bacterium]
MKIIIILISIVIISYVIYFFTNKKENASVTKQNDIDKVNEVVDRNFQTEPGPGDEVI